MSSRTPYGAQLGVVINRAKFHARTTSSVGGIKIHAVAHTQKELFFNSLLAHKQDFKLLFTLTPLDQRITG